MTIRRDWHYTDHLVSSDGQTANRKRVLQNWANYKDHAGTWHETEWEVRKAKASDSFDGLPLDWVAVKRPLNFFVGSSSAAGGRPWWGVRRSESSNNGIVMFLESGDASAGYTVNAGQQSATWEDVLPDTDLILYTGRAKLEKWLAMMSDVAGEGGNGDRVTIGFWLPNNWTLEVLDDMTPGNRIQIKRPDGRVVYTSRPAFAADSTGASVPCGFIAKGTNTLGGRLYYRVQVRCQPAGYSYPIMMDPTVEIEPVPGDNKGMTDTCILSGSNADKNWGALTQLYFGNSDTRRVMLRIDGALIPAGTITAASAFLYTNNAASQTVTSYQVHASDAESVFGTGMGAIQAGSNCWNWKSYNGTAWTAAGCGYIVDGTQKAVVIPAGTNVEREYPWHPSWLTPGVDADVIMRQATATAFAAYSTDSATYLPSAEIVYDEPVVGGSRKIIEPKNQHHFADLIVDPRGL